LVFAVVVSDGVRTWCLMNRPPPWSDALELIPQSRETARI